MAQNEIAGGVMFKMKDDPRITKGRQGDTQVQY